MIKLKRGDTGIGIRATLSNNAGNVDLTDADVHFLFSEHKIRASMHDAQNGVVDVVFDRFHTAQPGIFYAEFKVVFNDGRVETFPNDSFLEIHIINDLGGKI